MLKELFKQSKFYWICVCITSVLSYGFTLTNFAITADDEFFYRFINEGVLLAEGRWGYVPLRGIFDSYLFLPFWRSFIALILIVIGITLICGLFRKYSEGKFDENSSTIFACIAISFPLTAHIFVFMLATIELGLSLVLVGLALLCFAKWVLDGKRITYGIFSSLLLGYGIAFRETAIVFFMISGFSLLLLVFLYGKDQEKSKMKSSLVIYLKMAGVLMGSVLVWLLGLTLFQRLLSVNPAEYTTHMIRYDTSSISTFLRSVMSFVISFPIEFLRTASDMITWIIIGTSIALVGVGIVYAVRCKRVSIFLVATFIVISSFSMHLILGQAFPYYRIRTPFMFLVGFAFALVYILSSQFQWKKVKLKYFVVFASIWLVFFGSRQMNQVFYLDYLGYRKDVMVMDTIIHDLDGLQLEYPVLFVGLLPQQLPLEEMAGYSIFNAGRRGTWVAELHVQRAYLFFEMHGFPITHPGEVDKDGLLYYLADMENWPAPGYIRQGADFVIVKLGPSSLERYLMD